MVEFDKHQEISNLVLKYLKEGLDGTEKEKLENWLQQSDHNRQLFDRITQKEFIDSQLNVFSDNNKITAWENIKKATHQHSINKSIISNKLLRYAAVIAFLLITTGLLYQQFKIQSNKEPKSVAGVEILPGGNKATLTLSDGSQIDLSDVNEGELAKQQDAVITKTTNGQVEYHANSHFFDQDVFNKVSTPRGGEYQLILPDGTKVWLNSMSSIKFPVAFNGNVRKVELFGEAYFEVTKNKNQPFIVRASGVDVKVLGTKFNISSYNDERQVKTTLVEGSVKIVKGNKSALLLPGMQAICEGNQPIKIIDTDVEESIAWKNGYFLFRNQSIKDLMLTISRWYDVEVYYTGDLEGKIFGGKFSKKDNLSELLKSLEITGAVKFKVEGRRVTVMP